ncbi:OLC1v1012467C1 [Oldenlandia corymbosa var. corymbosa]|uniref:OLC1v1012467C1 n=1 Tax=Oldenlandia corymbosa var. corymbosa TaxID=529605 RepID=A0AAV1DZ08_OLDCO|nr:OLC1v1012467C1 [Oldenlandia corymbosa var. corymbosa]
MILRDHPSLQQARLHACRSWYEKVVPSQPAFIPPYGNFTFDGRLAPPISDQYQPYSVAVATKGVPPAHESAGQTKTDECSQRTDAEETVWIQDQLPDKSFGRMTPCKVFKGAIPPVALQTASTTAPTTESAAANQQTQQLTEQQSVTASNRLPALMGGSSMPPHPTREEVQEKRLWTGVEHEQNRNQEAAARIASAGFNTAENTNVPRIPTQTPTGNQTKYITMANQHGHLQYFQVLHLPNHYSQLVPVVNPPIGAIGNGTQAARTPLVHQGPPLNGVHNQPQEPVTSQVVAHVNNNPTSNQDDEVVVLFGANRQVSIASLESCSVISQKFISQGHADNVGQQAAGTGQALINANPALAADQIELRRLMSEVLRRDLGFKIPEVPGKPYPALVDLEHFPQNFKLPT